MIIKVIFAVLIIGVNFALGYFQPSGCDVRDYICNNKFERCYTNAETFEEFCGCYQSRWDCSLTGPCSLEELQALHSQCELSQIEVLGFGCPELLCDGLTYTPTECEEYANYCVEDVTECLLTASEDNHCLCYQAYYNCMLQESACGEELYYATSTECETVKDDTLCNLDCSSAQPHTSCPSELLQCEQAFKECQLSFPVEYGLCECEQQRYFCATETSCGSSDKNLRLTACENMNTFLECNMECGEPNLCVQEYRTCFDAHEACLDASNTNEEACACHELENQCIMATSCSEELKEYSKRWCLQIEECSNTCGDSCAAGIRDCDRARATCSDETCACADAYYSCEREVPCPAPIIDDFVENCWETNVEDDCSIDCGYLSTSDVSDDPCSHEVAQCETDYTLCVAPLEESDEEGFCQCYEDSLTCILNSVCEDWLKASYLKDCEQQDCEFSCPSNNYTGGEELCSEDVATCNTLLAGCTKGQNANPCSCKQGYYSCLKNTRCPQAEQNVLLNACPEDIEELQCTFKCSVESTCEYDSRICQQNLASCENTTCSCGENYYTCVEYSHCPSDLKNASTDACQVFVELESCTFECPRGGPPETTVTTSAASTTETPTSEPETTAELTCAEIIEGCVVDYNTCLNGKSFDCNCSRALFETCLPSSCPLEIATFYPTCSLVSAHEPTCTVDCSHLVDSECHQQTCSSDLTLCVASAPNNAARCDCFEIGFQCASNISCPDVVLNESLSLCRRLQAEQCPTIKCPGDTQCDQDIAICSVELQKCNPSEEIDCTCEQNHHDCLLTTSCGNNFHEEAKQKCKVLAESSGCNLKCEDQTTVQTTEGQQTEQTSQASETTQSSSSEKATTEPDEQSDGSKFVWLGALAIVCFFTVV